MSRMIPPELVNALRVQVNVSMDNYGQECTLYIPTNASHLDWEKKDIFAKPADLQYISYDSKVFIEWHPTAYKLKKLGLYVEDNLPIICWFGTTAVAREGSNIGQVVSVSITKQSYFSISISSVPEDIVKTSQFEILRPSPKNQFQDFEIYNCYAIAPMRVPI